MLPLLLTGQTLSAVGISGKTHPTHYMEARDLCQSFMYSKMMNKEGGVYSNYKRTHPPSDEFGVNHEVLAESIGLMLGYAYLTGNFTLFKLEERFARKRLLSPYGVFYWKLNEDMSPYMNIDGMYSSALIDDLRILKYVLLGYEKWRNPETLQFALEIMKGLWRYVSDEGGLVDYLVWSNSGRILKSDNLRLAYCDLEALQLLSSYDLNWRPVLDQTLKTILNGRMKQTGFYHEIYDIKARRYYTPGRGVNTIQQIFIALHLLENDMVDDAKDMCTFLVKEYLEKNVVADSYNPLTGSRGRGELDIGSYALLVQASTLIADISVAKLIMENKILTLQDLNSTSKTYGAFHYPEEDAKAWDNLQSLISLALMDKPLTTLSQFLGESTRIKAPIYDGFENIKYMKDKFSDEIGIRPPPWGFEVWAGHPKTYALCAEPRTGKNALKILSDDPRTVVAIAIPDYFQKPPIRQNVTYRFSAWIKMENVTGGGLRLFQQFFTKPKIGGQYIQFPKYVLFSQPYSGTVDWTLIHLDAVSTWPEIVKGDPGIMFAGRGVVWIDDVAFYEVKPVKDTSVERDMVHFTPRIELSQPSFQLLPGQQLKFYVKVQAYNARPSTLEEINLSGKGAEWIQFDEDLRFISRLDKIRFTLTIPEDASPGLYEVSLKVTVRTEENTLLYASAKLSINISRLPGKD
ncbi:MAG: hypothetical protein QXE22_05760 [Candidatus Bathyarchaeia archaeon]